MENMAIESFAAALIAHGLYECIQPEMILERYWIWLDSMQVKGYGYIAKPLGLCGLCLSGQLGMWYGLLLSGSPAYAPVYALMCVGWAAVLKGTASISG